MHDRLENDFADLWIDDGILYCEYKPYSIITLEAAKQVVTDRLKLQGELSLPVLCDIRTIANTEKPARDFMTREGTTLCSTIAFLAEPGYTKELLNFYLATNMPGIPVSLFIEKQKALEYLNNFKK